MYRKMALTKDLKKQALDVGFVTVGITTPNMLRGLPYGRVHTVQDLRTPEVLFFGAIRVACKVPEGRFGDIMVIPLPSPGFSFGEIPIVY
jgi:hypothetical protein